MNPATTGTVHRVGIRRICSCFYRKTWEFVMTRGDAQQVKPTNGIGWLNRGWSEMDRVWVSFTINCIVPMVPHRRSETWQILEKWHSANSANDTGQLVTKPWSHEIWRYACARESPTAYRGFSSPLVVQTWCLCWTKILGITGLNMGVSDIGLPYMYGHVYRMGKTRL